MKLSDLNPFKKKEVSYNKPEKPYIQLTDYELPEVPPKRSKDYLKEYKNWIYPNINAIANPVSGIEFELMQVKSNDEVEEVQQHPVLELLDRCNPYMTAREVIFSYVQHRKLIGEACWFIVRTENSDPIEIYPLRPDKITIQPGDISKNEFVKYYLYKSGGTEIKIDPANIVFFKDPDPENVYRGKGVIASSDVIIDIDNFSREWQKNLMFNGGATGATFSTENQLTDDQRKRLDSELRKKYQGAGNAGKIVLLEGGLKLQGQNASPKELDFINSRLNIRDEISAMFNNPKTVLGISDDVNRANAEATEYVHNKNVIKVEMDKLVDDLTEKLLPMFKGTENMFLTFDDPVPENEELDINKYKQLVDVVYTRNELREMEGLPPVDGGDVMYITINQVPLEPNTTNPQPPVKTYQLAVREPLTEGKKLANKYRRQVKKVMNRQVKTKLAQRKISDNLKKVLVKQIANTIAQKTQDEAKKEKAVVKWTPKNKQHAFEVMVTGYEKKMKDTLVKKWYPKLEKETIGYLNKKSIKSIDGYLFDETPAITAQIDLTDPIFTALANEAGQMGLGWIGSEAEFVYTDTLKKMIEANTLKLAKETVNTLREELRSIISAGMTEGKGTAQIVRDIRTFFSEKVERYEAERIVRTEMARGANMSLIEGWNQSGVVEGKEWILDGNPCESCQEAAASFKGGIALNEVFYEKGSVLETGTVLDYADVDSPPLHPNCMCALDPVFTLNKRIQPLHKKDKELEEAKKLLGVDDE